MNEQLEHKHKLLHLRKVEDLNYADKVRKDVIEKEKVEKKNLEIVKNEQRKYKDMLKKQIEDNTQKKRCQDLMSEHEKKINGMDLAAYENMEIDLHSKVIGVKDTAQLQPKSPSPTAAEGEHSDSPNLDLLRKINMPNVVYAKARNSPVHSYCQPIKLLETAIRNIKDPRVDFMRHNTHNQSYGYNGRATVQGKLTINNKSFAAPVYNTGLEPSLYLKNINDEDEYSLNKSSIVDGPLTTSAKAQMAALTGISPIIKKAPEIQRIQGIAPQALPIESLPRQSDLMEKPQSPSLPLLLPQSKLKKQYGYNIITGINKDGSEAS